MYDSSGIDQTFWTIVVCRVKIVVKTVIGSNGWEI